MSRLFIGLAWTVVVALATPASAAELRLEMSNGLVTLVATDTPIRQILAEWTRVGGTRIVNGERVAGPPVTLQLDRMPEQQALAVLLRSVAGYLAAPRRAGSVGASQYESVMILATSSPPTSPVPPTAARGPGNGVVRPIANPVETFQPQMPMSEEGQIAGEGFITVGSTPAVRPPPGSAMGASVPSYPQGPMAGANTPYQPTTATPGFPTQPVTTPTPMPMPIPGMLPPNGNRPPGLPPPPTNIQPGIILPNGQVEEP